MASAEEYAFWIVKNADKKGTPEFDTVAKAYQIAKSQGAQATPAPAMPTVTGRPTQKEDPFLPYAWNQFKQGFAAVPALVGMAGEALTVPNRMAIRAAMNVAGGHPATEKITENLFPASSLYSKGAPELLHYDPNMPVPKDVYGKPRIGAEVGGNIAGFLGASVLPSGGVIAKSATPIKALAKEIAGIALAGEGQTMGAHAVPERYKPAGEFVGSLMGPMAAQGVIEAASKGTNWVKTGLKGLGFTGMSEQARLQAGAQKAASFLEPQLKSPVSIENAAQAQAIEKKIPGYAENLTLGRRTGSPVIQAMEKHFGTTVPEALDLGQARQKGLQSAIAGYAEKRFPPAPEGITPIQGVVRTYEKKIASLDEATARLQQQEASLASKLGRGDMEDIGAQIKNVRGRLMEDAKKASDLRYKAVYDAANSSGMKVQMDDVKSLASSINKDAGNAFQNKPGVIGKILSRYATKTKEVSDIKTPVGKTIHLRGIATEKPAEPVTFEEFHSLYKEANREASELSIAAKMGNSEAAQKLRYVEQMKNLLSTKLSEMQGPKYGEVGKLLENANSFYKNKYAALFKRGVGGEMSRTNRFGPSTENAKIIPQLIFKPGDASGVKEYLTMANGDPQAYRALENGIMDMVSKKAVLNGSISKKALDSFLKTYHEPLSVVPGIRNEIETVQKATEAFARNNTLINAEKSAFSKSIVAKISRTENPDQVVANAIKSPSTMNALFSNASSQVEKQAVARAVMEQIAKQPDPLQYLTANENRLTQSLGQKHIGFLKTIFNAEKIAKSVEAPTHLAHEKLVDPLSGAIGTSIPQAISEAKMVQLRMGSRAYAVARVGVRFWNKLRNDKRDEILMDAIYNPKMAESLSKYMLDPTSSTANELNNHLFAYGVRAGALGFNLIEQKQKEKTSENKPAKVSAKQPSDNQKLKSAVEAYGWKYEPDKYDYRLMPDGDVQRARKVGNIDPWPRNTGVKPVQQDMNYSGPPRG